MNSLNDAKTCFKRVEYDLSGLLLYIDLGDIGLPDIQRPFVWTNIKVRDLFDSMYKGFPVGYLLFWVNAAIDGSRQIGNGEKQHKVPNLLIVDGQQRLTSLYAVFRGKTVLDSNYRQRRIEISFRPRDGKFEVADAATKKDPEYVPDISKLWVSGKSSYSLVDEFLKLLEKTQVLTENEKESISYNLDRLFDLQKYPFTALEIAPTVDEEHVADIFVRINSEGVKLNQADFILTLLSVFWDEGRKELEDFSRFSYIPPRAGDSPSPYNHFIQPGADQLLRVAIALGFSRGRLKSVYQVLRGKDLETGLISAEERTSQFARLKEAQSKVLNLTHWHQFFSCLIGAGFRSRELLSSDTTLLYAYALYLFGRTTFQVQEHVLQKLIGRWFYTCVLSGRYTSSAESVFDGDLNRIKENQNADEFVATLNRIIADALTPDFWRITLPNALESSSARSPELFAYHAAQIKLGVNALFSHKRISELFDPSIRTVRKPVERHHLFPRGWLQSQGIKDFKLINQIANFALLEWPDNLKIRDESPAIYMPKLRERLVAEQWNAMAQNHALPIGWENMEYKEFLSKRRVLMAEIIKRGFDSLE